MDVMELLKKLDADGDLEKTAAVGGTNDDPMVKLAQDIFAGGQLFARGFIAELQKQAAEGGTAEPSTGDAANDQSNWKSVATKIQTRHAMPGQPAPNTVGGSGGGVTQKKTPGENPGVTYEAVAPPQKDNPNPAETSGNVGTK